ncbi:hypothetical protein HDU97_010237 [Phlyctochytrium planicorne]|nr:hypothetical protein HDU97_010237 [Phlyctochytrium planicorne]
MKIQSHDHVKRLIGGLFALLSVLAKEPDMFTSLQSQLKSVADMGVVVLRDKDYSSHKQDIVDLWGTLCEHDACFSEYSSTTLVIELLDACVDSIHLDTQSSQKFQDIAGFIIDHLLTRDLITKVGYTLLSTKLLVLLPSTNFYGIKSSKLKHALIDMFFDSLYLGLVECSLSLHKALLSCSFDIQLRTPVSRIFSYLISERQTPNYTTAKIDSKKRRKLDSKSGGRDAVDTVDFIQSQIYDGLSTLASLLANGGNPKDVESNLPIHLFCSPFVTRDFIFKVLESVKNLSILLLKLAIRQFSDMQTDPTEKRSQFADVFLGVISQVVRKICVWQSRRNDGEIGAHLEKLSYVLFVGAGSVRQKLVDGHIFKDDFLNQFDNCLATYFNIDIDFLDGYKNCWLPVSDQVESECAMSLISVLAICSEHKLRGYIIEVAVCYLLESPRSKLRSICLQALPIIFQGTEANFDKIVEALTQSNLDDEHGEFLAESLGLFGCFASASFSRATFLENLYSNSRDDICECSKSSQPSSSISSRPKLEVHIAALQSLQRLLHHCAPSEIVFEADNVLVDIVKCLGSRHTAIREQAR